MSKIFEENSAGLNFTSLIRQRNFEKHKEKDILTEKIIKGKNCNNTENINAQKFYFNPKTTCDHKSLRWCVVSHFHLPDWMRDNEYLHRWHRPPMPSFRACFGSIFRLHSETGNIWTHLIGAFLIACIFVYFLCLPSTSFVAEWKEKFIFGIFFVGAILCLTFSTLYHILGCHSKNICTFCGKLDHSGIALMIIGSFFPWLYYSFYCDTKSQVIYLLSISFLGIGCIVITQWKKFATPQYRPMRAGLFAALGLSGVIPCTHKLLTHGFVKMFTTGQLGWFTLMAALYLLGAFLYAKRIPEKYFPGKCDLWFQSHQIFHVLVVVAAVIHYYGISNLQYFRFIDGGQCIAMH